MSTSVFICFTTWAPFSNANSKASFQSISEANYWGSFVQTQVQPLLKKSWDPTSQQILALGVFSVWGATGRDQSTRDQWRDHQQISAANSNVGDKLMTYGSGPLIAVAQYIWDRDNSYPHLRALVSTTIITSALKLSVGRERPDQSDHYSFPSGHSSSAFATATALSETYGWKVGALAFPLATFVALSRLADNKHWLSDVVGGAFIGVWMGRARSFAIEAEAGGAKQAWILLPTFQNESLGALYRIEF